MNNPSQQIKQMARTLFKAKAGSSYEKILHPNRDWFIGVVIAVCLVAGIAAWNGYTYFSNREGGTTDTEITVANPRYQAELVGQALGVFESRSKNFLIVSANSPLQPVQTETVPTIETSTTTATSTPEVSAEIPSATEEEEGSAVDQTTEVDTLGESETQQTPVEELGTPELSQ
jgi:cytoskeletal protein RodZ